MRPKSWAEAAVRWRVCPAVSWRRAMGCQADGLPLVRVLSLPVAVLWSAWWLMTALWRLRQADSYPYVCVCVCMREGFYMQHRGHLFGGVQNTHPPPTRTRTLLSCWSRWWRGREEVSEETGVIERGQWGRSDTGQQETREPTRCDGTHR